jgi:hypothetical protein
MTGEAMVTINGARPGVYAGHAEGVITALIPESPCTDIHMSPFPHI